MSLQGKTIALIGGAGFIGHNLALTLAERGARVHIVDGLQVNNLVAFASSGPDVRNRELYLRMLNQRLDLLRQANIDVVTQDARDYHALTRVMTQISPEDVVHLAAV